MIVATRDATGMAITTVVDATGHEPAPVHRSVTTGPVMTETAGTVDTVAIEATAAVPVMADEIDVMRASRAPEMPLRPPPPRMSGTAALSFASSLPTASEALSLRNSSPRSALLLRPRL